MFSMLGTVGLRKPEREETKSREKSNVPELPYCNMNEIVAIVDSDTGNPLPRPHFRGGFSQRAAKALSWVRNEKWEEVEKEDISNDAGVMMESL